MLPTPVSRDQCSHAFGCEDQNLEGLQMVRRSSILETQMELLFSSKILTIVEEKDCLVKSV